MQSSTDPDIITFADESDDESVFYPDNAHPERDSAPPGLEAARGGGFGHRAFSSTGVTPPAILKGNIAGLSPEEQESDNL